MGTKGTGKKHGTPEKIVIKRDKKSSKEEISPQELGQPKSPPKKAPLFESAKLALEKVAGLY